MASTTPIPGMPGLVTELADRCRRRGARALLVGGGVRDWLLGRPHHDWDVEVFGLDEDALHDLLTSLGPVNAVGKSFGVFKLGKAGQEIDVSLPRRDSKVGAGHRGIRVEGDPTMTPTEAARRRDLTVNAIFLDPLTGEIVDPWHGRDDLARRTLRAVDKDTFLEDPLRALRVVQFAARLDFSVDPSLVALCEEAALDELPAERVQGEWVKLLLKGVRPSLGMAVARDANILPRVFPEAPDVSEADAALDRLAAGPRDALDPEGRRLAVMLATWLSAATPGQVEATLDRLWLHKWKGYPLRERVLGAVAGWRERPASDTDLRRAATRHELRLTLTTRWALTSDPSALDALARAEALDVAEEPAEPVLKGRHLKALGFQPGPAMGEVLRHVYERQLDGAIADVDEARAEALKWKAARR